VLSRVRKLFSATARTPIFSTLFITTTLSIGSNRTAMAPRLPIAQRISLENTDDSEPRIRSPVLTSEGASS
jgi:hypothetical protein